MTRRPHVVLLTVDALRADRTNLYGYDRPTTPNLVRFADESLVCETALSLAPFTQSACVQLFTSTRPLGYGGYDGGAIGRPPTLFDRFRAEGYHTVGLSTLHWVNRFFGYGAGFEEEELLFTPNTLVGVAIAAFRSTLKAQLDGALSPQEAATLMAPWIGKLFRDIDEYACIRTERRIADRAHYPDSNLVNAGYDYDALRRVAARHREEFEADAVGYIASHLNRVPRAHEWLAADWHRCRTPWKLACEAAFRAANRAVAAMAPQLAAARQNRFRHYVDASALADRAIGIIRDHRDDRPLFLWVHFMDTHNPFTSGRGRRWYREAPDYLEAVGHPRDLDVALHFADERPRDAKSQRVLSALYDGAVRWTDEQLGRIVAAVDATGRGADTVVAISGDHGEEIGDHGDVGHYFLFYEHSVRVPMLFRRRGQAGRRIEGLVTSLDLAPTLAEAAGIAPAPGWEGAPVASAAVAARPHVVMETFYGGNCLFAHRPIYLGVRSRRHKLMWHEWRDPADHFSPEGPALYDIVADPTERTNLYREGHPDAAPLLAAAARRFAEFPEIDAARVRRAFGALAEPALAKAAIR